ncbi:MAG: hypothetical protein Q8N51_06645 [Gammaproteobacteria bacterium]|nr:hypothetical protein [Gammaproteobacteria bacterium]
MNAESSNFAPPQPTKNAAPVPVGSLVAPSVALTTWQRLKQYLEEVLPKPLAGIFKYSLGRVVAYAGAVFLVVMMLPLLSILALNVTSRFLPDPAAKWLRLSFVSAIHSGYDIDRVREELKQQASADVLARLSHNNQSLDYIQYLEFNLTKADSAKEIPTRIHHGQRAEISVLRSEVGAVPNPADLTCSLAGLDGSAQVLSVLLDRFSILSVSNMTRPSRTGKIDLSKEWWAKNEGEVRTKTTVASNGDVSVFFQKTPEFDKAMPACAVLKVEAVVAVFKQEVKAGI